MREEAEQVVALLPPAGSRSVGGGNRPWWLVEQVSAVAGPDGEWFVELRWSQNGFRRGDRQRDLVSFVTGDRVVSPAEMASDTRLLVIEEPHGTGGTAAADGRVWWDSADGGEPTEDWSPGRADSDADGTSEVVAVWMGPRPADRPAQPSDARPDH